MLVFAAVCPHPPLLVPEMAGEAAHELDGLRAACGTALRRLGAAVKAGADLIVVGGATVTRTYDPDAVGTLQPFGLALTFGKGGGEELPLSLSMGRWLMHEQRLEETGARFQAVAYDATPQDCLSLGRDLAQSSGRVALLVMGDGSACLTEKAPGYLHPGAGPYDAAVAEAFSRADAAALAGLDPETSREVQAAGRAAWQVLAGAARAASGTAPMDAELLAHEAPYGVGYLVATWNGSTPP